MQSLLKILTQDSVERPEPRVTRDFSVEEIIETVIENPRIVGASTSETAKENVDLILNSKTYTFELPNLLPYIEQLVVEIVNQYSTHQILPAARDAEPFYDALKIVLENDPRQDQVHLLPGSTILMSSLRSYSGRTIRRPFLSHYAITEENLQQDRKYLLFDTGFLGTIGRYLREIISFEFKVSGVEAVDVGLVSADKYSLGRELKLFNLTQKEAEEKFPKTFPRCILEWKSGHYNDNFYLGVALQLLPKFHGSYKEIGDGGKPIARKATFEKDIDQGWSVNDSIVNPVAALLVQKRVVEYFTKRREQILAKIN